MRRPASSRPVISLQRIVLFSVILFAASGWGFFFFASLQSVRRLRGRDPLLDAGDAASATTSGLGFFSSSRPSAGGSADPSQLPPAGLALGGRVSVVSWSPRAFVHDGFLSPSEVEEMLALVQTRRARAVGGSSFAAPLGLLGEGGVAVRQYDVACGGRCDLGRRQGGGR